MLMNIFMLYLGFARHQSSANHDLFAIVCYIVSLYALVIMDK
jgi:hypothetical protein